MASITGLMNRALAQIGAKRLISLDDNTAPGQLARDTYDDIRQGLLQAHNWPFAIFLYQLAQEAIPPAYGRKFSYRKPQATDLHGELLRTLGVFSDPGLTSWAVGYIDAGPTLYADQPALYMHGLYDITDPNRMSSLFREALTYKCASEWALTLSGSRAMHSDYAGQYEAVLLRARAIADMEGSPTQQPPSSWEIARFGGGDPFAGVFADPTTPSGS